jgi:secondary thiamine-phosphate synthase enzyme
MHDFTVRTQRHTEFVNIDRQVQEAVRQSGVRDGVAQVFVPHTTAGITINENADPDVTADIQMVLDRMVPWQGGYAHNEGNTAAHVKASLMGFSTAVLVKDGALQLGTWQSIYFCEFDGPRSRKAWVQVTGK